jgi:hypothetical protein
MDNKGAADMAIVNDLVKGVIDGVLGDILKKATGIGKRARRRRNGAASRPRSAGPSGTLQRIERLERLLRPHKKQASRRKTAKGRSLSQRRRVAAKTRAHKRSLRRGAAIR